MLDFPGDDAFDCRNGNDVNARNIEEKTGGRYELVSNSRGFMDREAPQSIDIRK